MDDVVAWTERLVAARSHNPGGDEPALARLLGDALGRRGADEVVVREVPRPGGMGAYVFARFGRPRLLVNAHLDTVPPNAGWHGDPFVARREGDRLVGLGACDTKGAIAAILCALAEERPADTMVLFSGDEEHSCTCMRAFLGSGEADGLSRAIVCEPTGLSAGTRHRGIFVLEVAAAGEGGHSSRADQLRAPLAEIARLAAAFDVWGRARRLSGPPGFPGLCTNVGLVEGGVAFNVVAARARLVASLRPPPGSDIAALQHELETLARNIVPDAAIAWPVQNPPFATRDAAAFVPLVPAAVAPVDLMFWTEAALLSQAGIDAVVVGPGQVAQAHAPDEHVALDELTRAVALFRGVFQASRSGDGAG